LLAYGIYRVGDLFNVFADRYELVTLVPSAAGLLEGSAVTLAGQRVGQVDEIEFLPVTDGGPNHLSIRFSVDEKVREHIRADSWARIRTQGLLGDKYIDITPGTAAYAVLSPGDTIPSLASVELEDLLVIATETLDTLQLLISDMRQISTALVRGEGTLGHLLTDATLYERMVAGTTELRELLAQINDGDGTLGRIIRDPALYEELTGAIARVDSVALLILEGEGTVGRLLKDDELYQRLLAVVGRADTAIGTLGVAPHDAGIASALLNVGQQVGGSMGTALLSTLSASAVTSFMAGKTPTPALAEQAAVHGFTTAFWWSAAIFVVGAIVSAALFRSGAPEVEPSAEPVLAH